MGTHPLPMPHVLVVEDEEVIRLETSDFLRSMGFWVYEAINGDEAIQKLQNGLAVDVVVSDVRMPGSADGFQVAAWVRQNTPYTKTILTSGDMGLPYINDNLCNQPFFIKPYNLYCLASQIRRDTRNHG